MKVSSRTPITAMANVAPSTRLRVLAVLAALAGVWTLVAAQLTAPAVAALAAVAIAGTAAMSALLVSPAAAKLRRQVAIAALGLASAGALAVNGGSGMSDHTATVLGVLLCAAATAHGLVLDTVRDVRVNIAVSVSMLLLAAGLAPGLGIAAPVVVTWCVALMALVVAAGEAQGSDAAVSATTTGGAGRVAGWGTLATVVTVAVLVGLAFALVLPHPPGVSARSSFGGGDASRGGQGSAARTATAYLGDGELNLNDRGKLDDRPVAVVTGPPGEFWRATVLATYDGRRWAPPGRVDGLRPLSDAPTTTATIPADARSPETPRPAERRDGVGWVSKLSPVLLSPGVPTSVDLRQPTDLFLGADGRISLSTFESALTYTVTSTVVPNAEDVTAPERGLDATDPIWTALPAGLPDRVHALAREVTNGTTGRAAAIAAIETYLRGSMTYDLNSPVTPRGQDSVDDFLFNSRSGFCEHFAAAEVVLLRSLGIPARMTSGFLSGTDTVETNGTQQRVLRNSDAHAWVEAWIPGTGWVASDPTAGATLAEAGGLGLTALVQKALDAATENGARKAVLALVLVLVALAVLFVPRRLRRRARRASSAPVPTAPLFAAFHRYEQALATAGRPRGPAESVRTLASRGEQDDRLRHALLTVERASYAPVPPAADETGEAARAIDDATALLLSGTPSR